MVPLKLKKPLGPIASAILRASHRLEVRVPQTAAQNLWSDISEEVENFLPHPSV